MAAFLTQLSPTSGSAPLRRLTGHGLEVLVVHEGHSRARDLRRAAARMKSGDDQEARLAAADLLDWAADHPEQALHSAEALWDSMRLAAGSIGGPQITLL